MFHGPEEHPSPRQMLWRTLISHIVMFIIFYVTGLMAVGRL